MSASAGPTAQARCLLFVPGHPPERFDKALASVAGGAFAIDGKMADAPVMSPAQPRLRWV